MEQKFKVKDFRNLYRILYILELDKERILSNGFTFSSLDDFIRGFMAASHPEQLEFENSPNFVYFGKWLKGHLTEDVDISLHWSTLILNRNVNNDEKAFEDFFNFFRIFKDSRFTTRTLIVDADSRSYSRNMWIQKHGQSNPNDTFLDELHKIRWMQLSNSTSIWIDFLDECNNEIDEDWYLNEQKAYEALATEFGHFSNDWFNENISNN